MIIGISIILFTLMTLSPVDYVDILAASDPNLKQEDMDNLRHSLGLDRPPHEQYIYWLVGKNSEGSNFLVEFGDYVIFAPFRFIEATFDVDLGTSTNHFTGGFIFGNMGEN